MQRPRTAVSPPPPPRAIPWAWTSPTGPIWSPSATPSGSTAYNFSAGGPILSHGSNSFVITPICPQSKVFSSLVVSKDEVVNVFIEDDIEEVYLSIDGCDRYPISKGDVVEISKSNNSLCLIKFIEQNSIYEAVHKVVKGVSYNA